MARAKGMLNLSGNLEVNAQAPLDARTIVPTEADLTVANNFPYPYIGLEVYVTGTGKKFRLLNLDTTQSSSWQEIGEGGGGSGLPSGGTAGQYLVKQSATEGDADWQSLSAFTGATSEAAGAAGLVPAPAIGDESKVLFGNGSWGDIVMPSVDYSQQSVESNIFDTNEKVIGQWTDGKLLYQKTIPVTIPGRASSGVIATTHNEHGISNFGELVDCKLRWYDTTDNVWFCNFMSYPTQPYGVADYGIIVDGTNINIMSNNPSNAPDWSTRTSNAYATIQYTKTTDSPLASDEKYAGLTASGEVIYKKTGVFGLSDRTNSGSQLIWKLKNLFSLNSNDTIIDIKGMATGKHNNNDYGTIPLFSECHIIANNNSQTWKIDLYYGNLILVDTISSADAINDLTMQVTIQYTKTS